MSMIVFYEKPGCQTNTRQKRLLEAAGHIVIARSLLTEPWTAARLQGFFGNLPVADWFNAAAPAVKSGAVNPQAVDAGQALALMLASPLLIKRPLLEIEDRQCAGFNPAHLAARLGLHLPSETTPQGCSRPDSPSCPTP